MSSVLLLKLEYIHNKT